MPLSYLMGVVLACWVHPYFPAVLGVLYVATLASAALADLLTD